MKNFIPLTRQDRLREINEYKSRGYVFREGENYFRFVRNIIVSNFGLNNVGDTSRATKCYYFQVRVEMSETRFYILQDNSNKSESCIYLTLSEIYKLLLEFSTYITTEKIVTTLMGDREQKWVINYTGLEFELNFFSNDLGHFEVIVPDSNITITYENLLVLIALIQDKSNFLWRDNDQKDLYEDGLLRMLCCLISTTGNEILQRHEWIYDAVSHKYAVTDEKHEKKYYLTPQEYKNIMEV